MTGDSNWSSVVTLIHFDGVNASTSFHDSSLSGHTIAESFGGQIGTAEAAFGTASADFVTNHGSGPCIRVSPNGGSDFQFGSGTFTIECWVYPTTSNNGWIMQTGVGGSGVGAWGLAYNSSTPALTFTYSTDGSTNTNISGTCTLGLNTWTHVAADYDGTTLRVYASGSVVASGSLSGALYATTQELAIGNDNHTDSGPWNGYIDEMRVTKGVARYAGGFTPPTAAFPAYGTSPQPELGGAGSGNVTNSSLTYNVTTWEPNDILVVAVFNENNGTGNPATVASITSSGLTFAQRSSVSQTDGGGMEVWWALAATPLIAQSLTIAFTGTFDDASSVAYGVAGCATGAPWDSNGSLPQTASGFSITGFSTTSADDCLVTFVGSASGEVNPFGFTVIVTTSDSAGSWGTSITTGYQDVSSPQTNSSLAAGTGTFAAFIADALTADSSEIDDSPSITGVAGTGAAGTITLEGDVHATGVASSGSAGTASIEVDSSGLGGAGGTGQPGQIGGGIPFTIGVSGYGAASLTQTALVGDPSWTVTGTWFTDTSTPTSQERIYTTTFGSSTNIQAIFTGDQLDVTVQTSLTWGVLGIYASDNSTLLATVTCNVDTGGALITTTLNGFGDGTHTIYLRKTANDSNPVVLVSLAWRQESSPLAEDTITLVGVAGTGASGTIIMTTIILTGVGTNGAAGSVSDQIGAFVGGVATSGAAGTQQDETDAAINGVETDGAASSLSTVAGSFVPITGIETDSAVGAIGIEDDASISGVETDSHVGLTIPEFNDSVSITGVETDSAVGVATFTVGATPNGVACTSQLGTFSLHIDSNVPFNGVAGTTQIGSVIANDATASPVTWNFNDVGPTGSLSSDHFTFTVGVNNGLALTAGVRSTSSHTTGKWYFEIAWTGPDLATFIGIANASWPVSASTDLGWDNNSLSLYATDAVALNGSVLLPSGIGEQPGSVYGVAVDFDAKLIWFTASRMRNVAGFNWNNSATANPATAVGGIDFSTMNAGPYFIAGELDGAGSTAANLVLNAGDSGFTFPVPAGFSPWEITGIGVAAIGAAGSTMIPILTGVAGLGFVADSSAHDRRSLGAPVIADVSVAINGVSCTGKANAISLGFVTNGGSILNNSNVFTFKGVNFFQGYANPGTFAGLPFMSWQNNLNAIQALGFNTVRLSMFMAGIFDPVDNWPLCSSGAGNVFAGGLNTDLTGLNTLQFYDLVVDYCATIGLYVVVDMHSTVGGITSGFTTSGEFSLTASPSSWSADSYTDTDFITAWTTIATRWAGKQAFIACDLMNEPQGPGVNFTQWGPGSGVDLHDLFTRTGNAIHAAIETANPNYALPLILCQTHDSDFSNVPTYPLSLAAPNKAVYAPHVFPSPLPNGYPASGGVDHGTGAMAGWNAAWGFLVTNNEAPVYITAFGGTLSTSFPNQAAFWGTITPYILGLSGYSGAPTQPIGWTVSNWDEVEGGIIGEDNLGILNGWSYPHPRPTFYFSLLPYIPELLGGSSTACVGVGATGGAGFFQTATTIVLPDVSASGAAGARAGRSQIAGEVDQGAIGVEGDGAAGTIGFFGLVIPGVSATGAAGTVTIRTSIPSVVAFGQVGTPQAQFTVAIAVTGTSGSGQPGNVARALFIGGVATVGAVGLETLLIQVPLPGVIAAGQANRMGPVARSRQPVMMIAQ